MTSMATLLSKLKYRIARNWIKTEDATQTMIRARLQKEYGSAIAPITCTRIKNGGIEKGELDFELTEEEKTIVKLVHDSNVIAEVF